VRIVVQARNNLDEQVRAQLDAAGLAYDEDDIATLLPAYAAMLDGVDQIARIDLGEMEPVVILPPPPADTLAREPLP
jgi:hypothetical protein